MIILQLIGASISIYAIASACASPSRCQNDFLTAIELKGKPASEPIYMLTFDYDFAEIPADNGPVYMRADASDIAGYWYSHRTTVMPPD